MGRCPATGSGQFWGGELGGADLCTLRAAARQPVVLSSTWRLAGNLLAAGSSRSLPIVGGALQGRGALNPFMKYYGYCGGTRWIICISRIVRLRRARSSVCNRVLVI